MNESKEKPELHPAAGGSYSRQKDGSLAKNGTSNLNARSVTLSSTGGRPGATLDAASSGKTEETK